MAEHDNRDSKPKRSPRRRLIRLTRNIFVYYRKPVSSTSDGESEGESYTRKTCQYIKDFGDRIEKEAWDRPIEFIGLLILFAYTTFAGIQSCKMREANKLTQQIVRSTVSASLFCAVSSGFSHMGSRDVPMTGAFYVACNNQGKVTAQGVSGVFTLAAKSFPDEQVLYSESWPFGGKETVIFGNDSSTWPFHAPKYCPETEPQQITARKEIIIGNVVVSFADETGETVTRRFCNVEMNWANLGGSPDSWAPCQTLIAEKAMLAKHNDKSH